MGKRSGRRRCPPGAGGQLERRPPHIGQTFTTPLLSHPVLLCKVFQLDVLKLVFFLLFFFVFLCLCASTVVANQARRLRVGFCFCPSIPAFSSSIPRAGCPTTCPSTLCSSCPLAGVAHNLPLLQVWCGVVWCGVAPCCSSSCPTSTVWRSDMTPPPQYGGGGGGRGGVGGEGRLKVESCQFLTLRGRKVITFI